VVVVMVVKVELKVRRRWISV